MSCDNLYTSQSFPPLGISDSLLEYQQVKIINLEKVQVQQTGQVLLESNFVVGFTSQGLNLTINVLRDGQTISGGAQTLVTFLGSTVSSTIISETISLSFSIVDSDVRKGSHSYSLILTNTTPTEGVAAIQTYGVTIKSFGSQKVYSTQSYPPSGTSALTIPAGQTISINLPGGCGVEQFLLSANINVIYPISGVNLLINLLRSDLTSVINGPQTLLKFSGVPIVPPVNFEYNFGISALDKSPSDSYTLQLINFSNVPVEIDFYSFIGQNVGKIGIRQEFPPLGITELTIPTSSSTEIPLKVHLESGNPVQLIFNTNVIVSIPTLLFDIVRDGKSITNGKQIFFGRSSVLGDTLEGNENILVVDSNPCPGKSKYILKLYNIGFTDITLDYYSFTAQQ